MTQKQDPTLGRDINRRYLPWLEEGSAVWRRRPGTDSFYMVEIKKSPSEDADVSKQFYDVIRFGTDDLPRPIHRTGLYTDNELKLDKERKEW